MVEASDRIDEDLLYLRMGLLAEWESRGPGKTEGAVVRVEVAALSGRAVVPSALGWLALNRDGEGEQLNWRGVGAAPPHPLLQKTLGTTPSREPRNHWTGKISPVRMPSPTSSLGSARYTSRACAHDCHNSSRYGSSSGSRRSVTATAMIASAVGDPSERDPRSSAYARRVGRIIGGGAGG